MNAHDLLVCGQPERRPLHAARSAHLHFLDLDHAANRFAIHPAHRIEAADGPSGLVISHERAATRLADDELLALENG
jgi:hypothetical protein